MDFILVQSQLITILYPAVHYRANGEEEGKLSKTMSSAQTANKKSRNYLNANDRNIDGEQTKER